MTAYIDDLDSAEREIRHLRSAISDLETRCEALESEHRDAEFARAELSEQIEHLSSETEQGINDTAVGLSGLRAEVGKMAGQVRWLEHHLLIAAGITPASLDIPGAADLARTITEAGKAKAALLTASQRDQLTGQITHYDQLCDLQRDSQNTAVAHARTIAETGPAAPARAAAVSGLGAARRQHEFFTKKLAQLQPSCDKARAQLAADDQQHTRLDPVITAGEQARATLYTRARAVIGAALAQWELMPGWFTAALGYEPPAASTERWLETAASLLAFRHAYAISDPAPLGRAVDSDDPDRRQWHADLDRKIRGFS